MVRRHMSMPFMAVTRQNKLWRKYSQIELKELHIIYFNPNYTDNLLLYHPVSILSESLPSSFPIILYLLYTKARNPRWKEHLPLSDQMLSRKRKVQLVLTLFLLNPHSIQHNVIMCFNTSINTSLN